MRFFRKRQEPTFEPASLPTPFTGQPGLDGLVSYSHNQLPAPVRFEDIPVVPITSEDRMIFRGGPVWPDWEGAVSLRHQRSGLAVDQKPDCDPDRLENFARPAIWGGHFANHFGHFLAEHSTRLLVAARARPDLPILMTLPPGMGPGKLPRFFWQVLNWYGIDGKKIHFVSSPLKVQELWAVPMAEQWANVPPSEAYLDLLDDNARRQGLMADPGGVVYVARDRFEQTAEGHNAGETYLTSLLPQLGVSVLRPEAAGLQEQMKAYQGAHTLIFAEGSAMHGRQLLGRCDQHIVVLNRRPRMRIALSALHPRCRTLSYAEVTRGAASVLWPHGAPWIVRAISVYDTERLLQVFAALGVPLADLWDQDDYLKARDGAIRTWMQIRFHPDQPIDHGKSLEQVVQEFRALNLGHLAEELQTTYS